MLASCWCHCCLYKLCLHPQNNMTTKEEYMSTLFEMFPPLLQTEIKMVSTHRGVLWTVI